jgi:O-acetyl-ADP-ribose deacetylase (regulator of RNase III)
MTTIVLCAVDQPLHAAWNRHCGDLENVEVHQGSILEAKCDAVVSPANSFGFMDGGIDMAYSQHFGWHIQERLQQLIRTKHHGELLVGNAEIVETDNVAIPFLIAAPTMRIPTVLRNTVNPYLAARAVLLLIRDGVFVDGNLKGERISDAVTNVAFPGLGTGVGQVPPEICGLQMRAAIDQVIFDKPGFPTSWADASERHQRLYSDRVTDLQFGE